MAVTARAADSRPRRKWLSAGVFVLVLGGCSQGPAALTIVPVIDSPVDDADATAIGLDSLEITVAHANGTNIESQVFKRGQPLQLTSIPFGDDLVIHMWGPNSGTQAIAYGRTCIVSVAADAPPPAPHLFFARIAKFGTLDLRPAKRSGGLAIPYLGSALLIAGHDDTGPVTDVERFDPSTGALTVLGMVGQRDQAAQAVYSPNDSSPRALVIGGTADNVGVNNIDVIEGKTIHALPAPDMGRIDLTATTLTDGTVLVVGGRLPGGQVVGDLDAIQETSTDDPSPVVRKQPAALAVARSGHTATRLGNELGAEVLIAGGVDGTGTPIDLAELYKPLSQQLADPATYAPRMIHPRSRHAAALLPDGSVLFIGGVDATAPVREIERFAKETGFFLYPGNMLKQGQATVDFATTILPDGRILITGGRESPGSPPIPNAYVIDVPSGSGGTPVILQTDSMAYARAGHQAVLLCDGSVLITGGTPTEVPAERYNPPDTNRH